MYSIVLSRNWMDNTFEKLKCSNKKRLIWKTCDFLENKTKFDWNKWWLEISKKPSTIFWIWKRGFDSVDTAQKEQFLPENLIEVQKTYLKRWFPKENDSWIDEIISKTKKDNNNLFSTIKWQPSGHLVEWMKKSFRTSC